MKRTPFVFLLVPLLFAVPARAASSLGGSWLPADYARHGVAIDLLFNWILWITGSVFAAVQIALVVILIRYRHRKDRRARFVRGSFPLELIWAAVPTVVLASLALASAKVWDSYRYSADGSNSANILVIGQQFKWNIIYPGRNGTFGRYLVYPKATDHTWPHRPGEMQHLFGGVPGPASLPYRQAVAAIDQFISQNGPEFQLGKDLSDPAGIDDDCEQALGRSLFVPVDRPVHITVLSRDVIHDLYLPNFRVQLYAVPGMAGSLTFTATQTTAQIEAPSRRQYTLDELKSLIPDAEYRIAASPLSVKSDGVPIAAPERLITPSLLEKLNAAGIKTVDAYRPAHLEAVCAQLCGVGHAMMKTDIVILTQEEYHRRFESQ